MGGEFHSELVSVYQWFGSIEPVRKPGNLTQSFLSKYVRKPSLHKTDFSGVDISGSIGILETMCRVFCIALGPVTICIAIGTIGLLYLFYNTE